jgi:hypothetical protein
MVVFYTTTKRSARAQGTESVSSLKSGDATGFEEGEDAGGGEVARVADDLTGEEARFMQALNVLGGTEEKMLELAAAHGGAVVAEDATEHAGGITRHLVGGDEAGGPDAQLAAVGLREGDVEHPAERAFIDADGDGLRIHAEDGAGRVHRDQGGAVAELELEEALVHPKMAWAWERRRRLRSIMSLPWLSAAEV